MTDDVRIGLALGGGVARGIAHIGVLQALAEHRIPVHLIAGTSAGSLVGAMYAAGLDPFLMERAAEQLHWRGLVRLKLRRDGLLDSDGLERFLLGHVGDLDFADLKMPFAAVACDLIKGEEILMQEGRVALAVRASSAFPGIFLPVRIGDRVLVDGGIVNNVPSTVCRRMGADYVIAVDLNKPRDEVRPPRNLLHIMLYSLALVQKPQTEQCLACANAVIQPDLNEFSPLELERVGAMIQAGRQAALPEIPRIKADLAALREQRRRQRARAQGAEAVEPCTLTGTDGGSLAQESFRPAAD